ncbi:MAG: Hsp20/alpha crystallin family protein [Rhodospirillales bacterium]|nr:Hsp20/alpha crystallin family protein [Rhodospirillales bacterium]MBO6785201.1 Hsp20/alpha crystallin family protein [Rhodospirillales bacterium]
MSQETTSTQEATKKPAKKKSPPEKQASASVPSPNGNVSGDIERYMDDVFAGWRGMVRSLFDATGTPVLPAASGSPEIDNWRAQADRYFADMRRRWVDMARLSPMSVFAPVSALSAPPVFDLHQDDEDYIISGAVPGMSADDISVELDGHMLTISGQASTEDDEDRNGAKLHSECTCSFSQRVCLPQDALADKIEATVENGVVTIRAPKVADFKQQTRKIAVKG